jgi:hypothetical protein
MAAAGIVIGVIILIVAVVAAVILVIIFLRRRASNPALSIVGEPCTTTADCPGSFICNTEAKVCVECVDDFDCKGDKIKCKPTTGKCVECVSDNSCFVGESCINDACCNPTPPLITKVQSTTSSINKLDITFDFLQGKTATAVIVVIEDPASGYPLFYDKVCEDKPSKSCTSTPDCPAGDTCNGSTCNVAGCFTFLLTASDEPSTVSISESLPGVYFYPGQSYRVKIKIVYTCGSSTSAATEFSNPVLHTFQACQDYPIAAKLKLVTILIVGFIVVAEVPTGLSAGQTFTIVLVGTNIPGVHPSFGVRSSPITLTVSADYDWVGFDMPFPARPLYVRAQRIGTSGECKGPVGNELEVTYST